MGSFYSDPKYHQISQIDRVSSTDTLITLHPDALGTPRLATNSQGSTVWKWEGEAFGETLANEDPDGNRKKTVVNLRYAGQYYDAETGLHYNWNRYYDPRIGRYITSNPIGLSGGLNTYAYVLGNPLRWTDPLGLDAEMCTRPIQGYIIPGQHCFVRYNGNNNDTSSFDSKGTHPDPAPEGASCKTTKGPQDDDCVKREMQKCENYDFLKNNCCHCAEQALKACGQSIPTKDWPNWPINPGPLPGEPKPTEPKAKQ